MPLYKYVANRFLTLAENILLGHKLSEYHTGYRAFSREILEKLPLEQNSDDFVFDNQMLAQIVWFGFRIGEVTCPTKYFEEASSINFRRSVDLRPGSAEDRTAVPDAEVGDRLVPVFAAAGSQVIAQCTATLLKSAMRRLAVLFPVLSWPGGHPEPITTCRELPRTA